MAQGFEPHAGIPHPGSGSSLIKGSGGVYVNRSNGPARMPRAPAPKGNKGNKGAGGNGLNNALLDPNQTLSGKNLYNAAVALANAQTSGPLAELKAQIAQTTKQGAAAQARTAGYFTGLGNFVNQGNQQETQIANDLNGQLAGIGSQTQGAIGAAGQRANSALSGFGQGQSNPGLQALTAELARQQGNAAQDSGTFRSFGAAQGANYRGLAASNLGVFGLRGQETLGSIGRANQLALEPLNSKIAGLQAQKGALVSTDLGKLRQQEINNQVTRQGLGLKQQTANATQALNKQKFGLDQKKFGLSLTKAQQAQMNADRTFKLNQQKFGYQKAQDLYAQKNHLGKYRLSGGGKGGGGVPGAGKPLPGGQQGSFFKSLALAEQLIHDAQGQKVNGKPPTSQQIRDALITGNNPSKARLDRLAVDAAFELLGWGHITPGTAAEMHGRGYRGGYYNGRPISVGPPPPVPGGVF